jgi:CubicO group peptidase (beta-lactamase class C family)
VLRHGHDLHDLTIGLSSRIAARLLTALLAVPAVASSVPAQEPGRDSVAPPGWQALVASYDAYAEADGIIGGGVVAVHDGKAMAWHDFGHADLAAGIPAARQTIYHWGSITKTLTAIAVMQLRDRGLLSLDDPVTYWVPELRQVHDPYGAIDSITVEMLLTHSSGFQNPTWPWYEGHDWEPFEPTTWDQLVAMMPYQQLHFRPGSQWSYSNPAFLYLARIIESLTGDSWQAYIQKNVLSPLDLQRSYFGTTPYWLAPDRSHNYYVEPDPAGGTRLIDNGADFDPGITIPNGGWNAPLGDLARFAAFLTGAAVDDETLRRFDSVLSRSSLEEMWKPRVPIREDPAAEHFEQMGLSFFLVRDGERSVIGHTGSQAGFRAFFYFQPEERTALIAVFNTTNFEQSPEAAAAYQELLSAAYSVADP